MECQDQSSMSVSDAERLRAEYKSNWRSMGEKSKKRLRDREQDENFLEQNFCFACFSYF